MIRGAAALLAVAVVGCTAPASAPAPVVAPALQAPASRVLALRNPGFELDPQPNGCAAGWRCSTHQDAKAFRYEVDGATSIEGQRSLRIERVLEEPWGLAMQYINDPGLRGSRLRFTLRVRTEGATGNGGGPVVIVHGGGGATIFHDQKLVSGTATWKTLEIEFDVAPGAEAFEIGATLEGPGKLWIDDARLEYLGPLTLPKKPV